MNTRHAQDTRYSSYCCATTLDDAGYGRNSIHFLRRIPDVRTSILLLVYLTHKTAARKKRYSSPGEQRPWPRKITKNNVQHKWGFHDKLYQVRVVPQLSKVRNILGSGGVEERLMRPMKE